jgi:WD40 repeat protein
MKTQKAKIKLVLVSAFLLFMGCINASFLQDIGAGAKIDFGTEIYAIAWHPDGKYCAVGGASASIIIYEFNGTVCTRKTSEAFGSTIYCLKWTNDGKYLAVGGDNKGSGLVTVYQWTNGSLVSLNSVTKNDRVDTLDWSKDGQTLVVGWFAKAGGIIDIYQWNGTALTDLGIAKSFGLAVYSVALTPNADFLAVAGDNDDIDVIVYSWDGSNLTQKSAQPFGDLATSAAWSPDGKQLAVGGNNGTTNVIVYGWDGSNLIDNGATAAVAFGERASSVLWSYDGRYVGVGGYVIAHPLNKGLFCFFSWDGNKTLTPVMDIQELGTYVYSVALSPNAKFFAVGGINYPDYGNVYFSPYTFNPSGKFENVDITYPYIFHDLKNSAGGIVKFEEGFTVLSDATTYLGLDIPVSGGIDLRETGKVILEEDLTLDSNCTLSGGGIMYGDGHTLFLNNDLKIPAHSPSILEIASDMVIDGRGNDVLLDPYCQIVVDTNVTLTLKNLTLKITQDSPSQPALNGFAGSSKIVLDNVTIAPCNDFYFSKGQLFIQNDVAFTGSSSFIYQSVSPCFITDRSCWYFAPGTTLDYRPSTDNKSLLTFQDTTANLYLDGCALHTTVTGLQLQKGTVTIDNCVTFKSNGGYVLNPNSSTGAISDWFPGQQTITSGARFSSCCWSPDGNHAVVGCYVEPTGGFAKTFNFVGSASSGGLGAVGTGWQVFGADKGEIESVAWSPNGKCVIVSGFSLVGTDYRGAIKGYSFVNGGTTGGLEEVGSGEYHFPSGEYSGVYAVAWSPDGNYFVAGNANVDAGEGQIKIFRFVVGGNSTGAIEAVCDGYQVLGTYVYNVAWSPDGNYIVASGYDETLGQGPIKTYRFTGTGSNGGLEEVGSGQQYFGTEVYATGWSPDSKYIVVGGYQDDGSNTIGYLKTYHFTGGGTTGGLEEVATGQHIFGMYVYSTGWSPDGNYIIAGNENDVLSCGQIKVFSFTRSGTQGGLETFGEGNQQDVQSFLDIAWRSHGNYILAESTGIKVYGADYIYDSLLPQAITNGITFGNAALGQDYDVSIKIAPGASINVNGILNYDNVN